MEKLIMNRQTGKTYQLIRKSAKSRDVIVCDSDREENRIRHEANKMGIDIPEPITYKEFINQNHISRDIKGLLIDNVELLVKYIAANTPVNAITLSLDDD